jgi:hypothetical protein
MYLVSGILMALSGLVSMSSGVMSLVAAQSWGSAGEFALEQANRFQGISQIFLGITFMGLSVVYGALHLQDRRTRRSKNAG